jgi:two-component system OmpR family response regulator
LDKGHILVVDDQREICDLVQEYLSSEGYYRVSTAQDGAGMRRVMAQSPVDLVILDLILPGEDGLTLTRSIRDETSVGIIILSGKGEPVERIIGLEMGADDYLSKPFLMRELLARVKSVLRRVSTRTTEKQTTSRSKAWFGGWNLDLVSRELFSPSGEEVPLTTGAFDLLTAFVNNRTIDVQVGRLRRKLKVDPKNPTMIKTVRRRGYIFTPAVEWD